MNNLLSIKQVCRLTNIPIVTLRNWEARYQIIKPQRNSHGQRQYSNEDVQLLKLIVFHLKKGMSIGEISKKLLSGIQLQPPSVEDIRFDENNKKIIEEYYLSLVSIDLPKVVDVEELIELTFDLKNRIEYIYGPLLERIGEDWSNGKISIAVEHFCSNYFRNKLFQIIGNYNFETNNESACFVCTTPVDELHEGGLLLICSMLKLRGYNIIYLGPNLLISEMVSFCSKIKNCYALVSISDPKYLSLILNELGSTGLRAFIGGLGVRLSDTDESLIGKVKLIKSSGKKAVEEIVNNISL